MPISGTRMSSSRQPKSVDLSKHPTDTDIMKNNTTKTILAAIALALICSASSKAFYGGGYGCGGGGYYGGYGYGYGSSSFGNQYGQWGNGQGATLSAIASIIGAAQPMMTAAASRPIEVVAPAPALPPVQVVNGTPCYVINGQLYPIKQQHQ